MADDLHRARSFGARAAEYAEHRPDYPAEGVCWALAAATRDVRQVLDLAAGTGKLTGGLLALGLEVTAVEPDGGMRVELARRLPGVDVRAGTAEEIPLPAGSVDAVLVGQAFHWFDADAALTEIARVLRPGGAVGALWNAEDRNAEWVAGLLEVSGTSVSNVEPDDLLFPAHPLFAPPEETAFRHTHRRTVGSLGETFATHSRMLVIDDTERAAVLGRIRDYLAARQETAGGEFDMPLVTKVVRATLGS
ncbi:MAG: methyltransferase domain-containing protein [Actinophytocola sp.]|uniref:class I SAM-dependent methyltransferase n=1 Tax=Actinophytocola sp. TaxID=1872138 RepID=UPI001329D8B6|nr:class I SAM-dependent methyltransferase [Actinophytocola sp.]MPZ85127.1 methyltransferase domain-containing protein [Actinophytocola sp.]